MAKMARIAYRCVLFTLMIRVASSAVVSRRGPLDKRQASSPSTGSTSSAIRPAKSDLPFGTLVTACTEPDAIALTFDDGPGPYTSDLLDLLDEENVKATFFIVGDPQGQRGLGGCNSTSVNLVKRAYHAGHHIGSHTWSHPDLNTLNEADVTHQMHNNDAALCSALGVTPTYMRPPYLDCDDTCQERLKRLAYTIVSTNLDTQDWANDAADKIQTSKDAFAAAISGGIEGPLVLAHDVHEQTVYNLTRFAIDTAKRAGYRFMTVGECLGYPDAGDWYGTCGWTACLDAAAAAEDLKDVKVVGGRGRMDSTPWHSTLPTSADGTCGADAGVVCPGSGFGDCCSQYGQCGISMEHCDRGCQGDFGRCSGFSSGRY